MCYVGSFCYIPWVHDVESLMFPGAVSSNKYDPYE